MHCSQVEEFCVLVPLNLIFGGKKIGKSKPNNNYIQILTRTIYITKCVFVSNLMCKCEFMCTCQLSVA